MSFGEKQLVEVPDVQPRVSGWFHPSSTQLKTSRKWISQRFTGRVLKGDLSMKGSPPRE
jgi:hypothetical protein